jgi:hypothetical protein
MPAISKKQQMLFGIALCFKRGNCKDASAEAKKLANEMTEKELEEFASTLHKDLPECTNESIIFSTRKVDRGTLKMFIDWLDSKELIYIFNEDEDQLELFNEYALSKADEKEFITYIDRLDLKKIWESSIATLDNTVGLGAVNPPPNYSSGAGGQPMTGNSAKGSGDRFDNGSYKNDKEEEEDDEEDDKNKHKRKKIKIKIKEKYPKSENKILKFKQFVEILNEIK